LRQHLGAFSFEKKTKRGFRLFFQSFER
jgi:hypothetical protein